MSGNRKSKCIEQPDLRKVVAATHCITEPIHVSVQALAQTIESEFLRIFERSVAHEHQLQKVLAEATLIGRIRAAKMLDCSLATLDRKVATGELEPTYLDSHPRFRLAELNRFILANTRKVMRMKHRDKIVLG